MNPKHAIYQRSLFAIHAAREPWRLLPPELLGEIFLCVVHARDGVFDAFAEFPIRAPTILSLVCSEWRAIALANPRLWTRIMTRGQRGIRTARIWLERSKHAPLVIECMFDEKTASALSEVLTLIDDYLNRVFELTIDVTDHSECLRVVTTLNKPAPRLRAFRLRSVHDASDPWFIPGEAAKAIFGGGVTPNLQFLTILSPGSEWPVGMTSTLTTLDLRTLGDAELTGPETILQLLESAVRLSVLRMEMIGPDNGGEPWDWLAVAPRKIITLPALVDIHLNGWLEGMFDFIDILDLPSLHSLHIQYEMPIYDQDDAPLPEVANTMPFPSLEKLRVQSRPGGNIYEGTILHCPRILRRCINMTHLFLCDTVLPLYVLLQDMRSKQKNAEPLCPSLVSLVITNFDAKGDGQSLLHLLKRRISRDAVATIDSVLFQRVGGRASISEAEAVQLFSPLVRHISCEEVDEE